MTERIQSFAEFWPFYVREHADARNRRLHFVGTSLSVACIACGLLTFSWVWLLIAFPVGYAFAWTGHFFVQKNRPATFTYPLWSFRADLRMWRYMLLGKMPAEVDKHTANSLK